MRVQRNSTGKPRAAPERPRGIHFWDGAGGADDKHSGVDYSGSAAVPVVALGAATPLFTTTIIEKSRSTSGLDAEHLAILGADRTVDGASSGQPEARALGIVVTGNRLDPS